MKHLFLLLLLISCSATDCKVGSNATVQTKIENKIDYKTAENKSDSKSIADQVRDFKDNLQPGAQLKCSF